MNDVDLVGLGLTLVASAVAVAVLMGLTARAAARSGRVSVVDVIWGLGFVLIAVTATVTSALRPADVRGSESLRWLLLVLVTVWGVRLGVHIARRNSGRPEDPRYVALLAGAPDPARTALRRVFLPQGVAMWVVSLPVQVGVNDQAPWWPAVGLGVLLWVVGLVFETVGDLQLSRFRADPSTDGTVLDTGLWRYTRHPNYFGDACLWWGIWCVAATSWLGLVAVVGPILMTYALVARTGKALLERGLHDSRPGYAEYVARTSGFLPAPPRRRPNG